MYLPSNFFFLLTLVLGLLFSVSSVQWVYVWAGLEINLIRFIPLMLFMKNYYEVERGIKYFIIQAISSSLMLILVFLILYNRLFETYIAYFFILCIFTKLGVFPFYFWFPDVIKGLHWHICFCLVSLQKFIPLILVRFMCYNIKIELLYLGRLSVMVGGLGGVSQTNIRLLISYSSIGHIGWALCSLRFSFSVILYYYIFYVYISYYMYFFFNKYMIDNLKIVKLYIINKFDFFLLVSCLIIIRGLPPFLGFLLKFMILINLCIIRFYFIRLVLVVFSLISFLYYLILVFNIMIEFFNRTLYKLQQTSGYSFSFFFFFLIYQV